MIENFHKIVRKNFIVYASSDIIRDGITTILEKIHLDKHILPNQLLVVVEDAFDPQYLNHALTDLSQELQVNQIPLIFVISSVKPSINRFQQVMKIDAKAYITIQDRLNEKLIHMIEHSRDGGLYLSPSLQKFITHNRTDEQLDILRKLPSSQRIVLDYYYTGLKPLEIATILNKTVRAIYKVLQRVRHKFALNSNRELFETLILLDYQTRRGKS